MNKLLGSKKAISANSSEEITKAIKHHLDHNLPLPESLTKKQDTVIKGNISKILKDSKLDIRGGVTTNEEGKEVFNYNEYNKWNTELRDAIKKAHPYVPETILEREIGNIVGKDKFLADSLDMHIRTVDLLKELAKTTDAMKVARSKDELTKAKDFEENPRLYLYEHIASSGAIGDILNNLKSKGNESQNIDNYNQTARNIQEVANRIYEVLHTKHNVGKPKGINTNELRIKAENAFSSLKIDTQWFYGNEASFDKMSNEEIIRAGEAPIANDSGTTGTTLERQLAAAQQQLRNTSPRNLSQRKELSTKIDEIKGKILSFRDL
jgi:predicted small metal-binding protein